MAPMQDSGGNDKCEACGSGSLDVVTRIISLETIRESVRCVCGESPIARTKVSVPYGAGRQRELRGTAGG